MTASTATTPTYPVYQSDQYYEWLGRELSRNLAFRRQCDEWNALPIEVHRARAAEIVADRES